MNLENNNLIKNLLENTQIVYDDKCKAEIIKLSIRYSNLYKKLFIFGEIVGEPNDYGIDVTVNFYTDDEIYTESDEVDTLFATFPGIQVFKASLSVSYPLLRCKSIKIEVERKYLYARDRNRDT